MSQDEPGADQDRQSGRQGEIGLSIPRDDAGERPAANRSRRRPGVYERLQSAAEVDQNVMARWFLPVTILLLLLLVMLAILYFAQGRHINALQERVDDLNERIAGASADTEIDRLSARVEELGERLQNAGGINTELEALRGTVAEQGGRIETLTDRLATLEKAGTVSKSTAVSGGAGSGAWVVNLITVADHAAAEAMQGRLNEIGVESRIEPVTIEDKSLQRVVVAGFETREAAEKAGGDLKARLKLSDDPWITQR